MTGRAFFDAKYRLADVVSCAATSILRFSGVIVFEPAGQHLSSIVAFQTTLFAKHRDTVFQSDPVD